MNFCSLAKILSLLIVLLLMPLHSQTPFEYNFQKVQSNRVILLGNQLPGDIEKWRSIIDSEGILEYGFILQNRASFSKSGARLSRVFGIDDDEIQTFEHWVADMLGVSRSVKWIALTFDNRLIAAGTIVPGKAEFDKFLEDSGIRSPARLLRAFLSENPDHLDTMADLLKEVRVERLCEFPGPGGRPGCNPKAIQFDCDLV